MTHTEDELQQLTQAVRKARSSWTGGPDNDYDELIAQAALEHMQSSKSSTASEAPAPSHLEWMSSALEEVSELMHQRGAKYGPGNIAQFGDYGVLVRLSDKLARLQHSIEQDFTDETAQDTWLDVIGYGLIGLAWSRGEWPGSFKNPRSLQVPIDPEEFTAPAEHRCLTCGCKLQPGSSNCELCD